MEGWWMVHTMVLPVLTMLRTVLITIAAALASNPEKDKSSSLPSHSMSLQSQHAGQGSQEECMPLQHHSCNFFGALLPGAFECLCMRIFSVSVS